MNFTDIVPWDYFLKQSFFVLKLLYYSVTVLIFCVSSFGRGLNVRRKYIEVLLKIFEFGNKKYNEKNKGFNEEEDLDSSRELSASSLTSEKNLISVNSQETEGYKLEDALPLLTSGISSIMEDSVTSSFVSEPLPYWNFLSRNNSRRYEKGSARMTGFWIMGFIVRYLFLLPARVFILIIWGLFFFVCTSLLGCLPEGPMKRSLNAKVIATCFDFVGGCMSLAATFHNSENRPKGGVAVANHTSPIDSVVLATDNCYDMVGQLHGGILGCFMRILSRSSQHIWFERSVAKDRANVVEMLKEHIEDERLPTALVFPEGVCVNNTSVMQFRKGTFELETEIYPIAIKFDPRLGDPFWWQDTFFPYMLSMMTSWAIVCDVWYLPPLKKLPNESAIDFADRVKAKIAEKAGLNDVPWEGALKTRPVRQEVKKQQQKSFASYLLTKETLVDDVADSNCYPHSDEQEVKHRK